MQVENYFWKKKLVVQLCFEISELLEACNRFGRSTVAGLDKFLMTSRLSLFFLSFQSLRHRSSSFLIYEKTAKISPFFRLFPQGSFGNPKLFTSISLANQMLSHFFVYHTFALSFLSIPCNEVEGRLCLFSFFLIVLLITKLETTGSFPTRLSYNQNWRLNIVNETCFSRHKGNGEKSK